MILPCTSDVRAFT